MEAWQKPTILVCLYGFFLYIKPSEPFLTPYLMGPIHNLTEEDVVNKIYPVWTYAYLVMLVPFFLLTDFLKYKPIILLQALGQISCWILLLFGRGVPLMQLMQIFYAIGTAGEVGYYSYIYSIVDESHYQRVTSYVRSATLIGYFLASLLSQLLVSLAHLSYFHLNVISLVSVSIAFVIALFLPMPTRTLFFFSTNKEEDKDADCGPDEVVGTSFHSQARLNSASSTWKTTLFTLLKDLYNAYTNLTLLRWSVWWALSTCGWLLVVNYIQNLWETIRPSHENEIYNGAVETVATVLGALGALWVGFIPANWKRWGEIILGFNSLLMCGLLMAMYWTADIWLCYTAYVLFITLYNIVITITQFQIAVGLSTQRFALVFGANTFLAVALNTILTVILIDQRGLALDVKTQFIVYSVYFGIIAIIFLVHAVYYLCKYRRGRSNSATEYTATATTPDDVNVEKEGSKLCDDQSVCS